MASYDDIIGLPHHTSTRHPPMSRADRAAQFAPFAALTGHGEAIRETARLTCARIELTEDQIAAINERLAYFSEHVEDELLVSVTYFQPDKRKAGGEYVTVEGIVQCVDDIEEVIKLSHRLVIPMSSIVSICECTEEKG